MDSIKIGPFVFKEMTEEDIKAERNPAYNCFTLSCNSKVECHSDKMEVEISEFSMTT